MTKLEVLRLIGDVVTDLDTAIGDLLPSDPRQRQLEDLRILLDDRQRRLSAEIFNENTAAFQRTAVELQSANADYASLSRTSSISRKPSPRQAALWAQLRRY